MPDLDPNYLQMSVNNQEHPDLGLLYLPRPVYLTISKHLSYDTNSVDDKTVIDTGLDLHFLKNYGQKLICYVFTLYFTVKYFFCY